MSETYPGCDICQILPAIPSEMVIAEDEYWCANLRDRDQTLLGTTFITLKRHAYELDQLSPAEEQSFITMRNVVLGALRGTFRPVTFNVSCLKNDAFQAAPNTTPSEAAHVHWHIKPRYGTQVVEFAGETFTDPLPGRYLSQFERKRVSPETAVAIAATIRGAL